MIRKLAVVLTLLVTPLVGMATEVSPYAGLTVGVAEGDLSLYDVTGVRHHFSNNGTFGGVAVGIGMLAREHFWLALEGDGDFTSERTASQTIQTAGGASAAKVRMRWTWGGSVIPGIRFSRALFFGRVGGVQSRFILKQDIPPAGSGGTSEESLAGGVIYGLGVQLKLTGMFHARVEYDRVVYRRFSSFGNRIALVDNQVRGGLMMDLS